MTKYFDWNPQPEPFVPGQTRIGYGGAMIGQEELDAMLDVITSQGGRRWTVGPESIAFEKELAKEAKTDYAVVTNSGSSALLAGISALPFPKGSKIIIPATTFPTAFNSIIQAGYIPVVVDSSDRDFLLDLYQTENALRQDRSIAAVLAVNIAGNVVDVDQMLDLREKYGVYILLDNCDGFGSLWKGKPVESYYDISFISFHAAHIITTGEGGAVLTNDQKMADRARKLREWGRAAGTDDVYNFPGLPEDYRSRYVYEEIGYNIKPLELQCAMGRVQLKKLKSFVKARVENYNKLKEAFKSVDFGKVAYVVPGHEDATVCWFGFPLVLEAEMRDKLMDFFESKNIETRNIFAGNIMRHPAYRYLTDGIEIGSPLYGADSIMRRGMFISNHPSLTDEMIQYIKDAYKEFVEKYAHEIE